MAEQLALIGHTDGEGPESTLLKDERTQLVASMLEELPDDARELLALRYGDELKHRDIARVLGSSESAVRKRLSRTLSILKKRSIEKTEKEFDHAT